MCKATEHGKSRSHGRECGTSKTLRSINTRSKYGVATRTWRVVAAVTWVHNSGGSLPPTTAPPIKRCSCQRLHRQSNAAAANNCTASQTLLLPTTAPPVKRCCLALFSDPHAGTLNRRHVRQVTHVLQHRVVVVENASPATRRRPRDLNINSRPAHALDQCALKLHTVDVDVE